MKFGKKFALLATAAALVTVATAGPSEAQRIRWKMHSAWGSSVPHLGTSAVRFSKVIKPSFRRQVPDEVF